MKTLIETLIVAAAVLAAAVFIGRRVLAALRGGKPSCYTENGPDAAAGAAGSSCATGGYCAGCSGCTLRKPEPPLQ